MAPPPLTTTTTTTTTVPTLSPIADTLTTLYVDGIDNEEASDQVAKSSIHTSLFNQIVDEVEEEERPTDAKLQGAIKTKNKKERNDITTTALPQTNRQLPVESITRRIDSINSNTLTTSQFTN